MAQVALVTVCTGLYLVFWFFAPNPTYVKLLSGLVSATVGGVVAVFILMWMGLATIDEIIWRVGCTLIGYVLAYIIAKMIRSILMPNHEQSA